jgi:hypothetical protein
VGEGHHEAPPRVAGDLDVERRGARGDGQRQDRPAIAPGDEPEAAPTRSLKATTPSRWAAWKPASPV